MAYINTGNDLPGIRGLMAFRPEIATALNVLAEALLRDNTGLSRGERELIAGFVSYLNECEYCQHAHSALAEHYLACDMAYMDRIKADFRSSDLSEKMKILLEVASSVQKGGKHVTEQQIQNARNAGATDLEIHDTVLIAAAFCMFNRYVDGLGTSAPADPVFYRQRAPQRAVEGYGGYDPRN